MPFGGQDRGVPSNVPDDSGAPVEGGNTETRKAIEFARQNYIINVFKPSQIYTTARSHCQGFLIPEHTSQKAVRHAFAKHPFNPHSECVINGQLTRLD